MSNVIVKGHRITMDTDRFIVKHVIDFSVEIFPEDCVNDKLDIEHALDYYYTTLTKDLK